jgi:hypothetical protein
MLGPEEDISKGIVVAIGHAVIGLGVSGLMIAQLLEIRRKEQLSLLLASLPSGYLLS